MNRQTVFRILLGIVIVGVLIAAGVAVFNAGAAYGLAQSGALAERLGREAPNMTPRMWGGPHLVYGWGWRPFGGGFGFLGCLVPLFFFFLLFWLIRGAFWRGPWGWRGGRHRAAPRNACRGRLVNGSPEERPRVGTGPPRFTVLPCRCPGREGVSRDRHRAPPRGREALSARAPCRWWAWAWR